MSMKPADTAPRIRVVVRKRPLTQKELRKGDTDIIKIPSENHLTVEDLKYVSLLPYEKSTATFQLEVTQFKPTNFCVCVGPSSI